MDHQGVQYDNSLIKVIRGQYLGAETLQEGYAMCYDADRGTVTLPDGTRGWILEKPSTTNIMNFAGWVHAGSNLKTGPQYITLCAPGSVCNVLSGIATVIRATRMTVCAGQWHMYHAGFAGKGSALALQTVAAATTAVPLLVQAMTDDGPQSNGVESLTSAGGAIEIMHQGVSFLETSAAGDAVGDMPDGTFPGQLKLITNRGTLTNDVHVVYTTYCDVDNWVTFNGVAGDANLTIWTGVCWCPLCSKSVGELSVSPTISPILSGDEPRQ